MENIVYARDYAENPTPERREDHCSAILNQAMNGPFMESYTAAMADVPKIVIPKYKENYEYLLRKCDELAKRWGGSIWGLVDYQNWGAAIDLILPFAEFNCPEDLALLGEIAEKSHSVSFEATTDGRIHISIFNRYFEEMASEEQLECIKCKAIMDDPELAKMIAISTELPPDVEEFANHLNPVLDVAEQVSGKDRTEIFLRLLPLMEKIIEDPDSFNEEVSKFIQDLASSDDGAEARDNEC